MYAEIPKTARGTGQSPLLNAEKVYTVTRFKVRSAQSSYLPVTGRHIIEFTCYTRIVFTKNPQDTFPAYMYMVVPFDRIRSKKKEKEDRDFIGKILTDQVNFADHMPCSLAPYGYSVSSMFLRIFRHEVEKEINGVQWHFTERSK
jgi:hypothetical protein